MTGQNRHGETAKQRRARRARERQLDYQRAKAARARGHEADYEAAMRLRSARVRAKLERVRAIPADARVLEVGSGAHGLVFFFGTSRGVGVDPLADEYAALFAAWQHRARTIAAAGEHLPFADGSFDVVLCDNVVDHAEDPARIAGELARVLVADGLLYFTVNVHHPVYAVAARLHSAWNAAGLRLEVGPFADHTVHLTVAGARSLFDGLPLRVVEESAGVADAKRAAREHPPRHAGDRLKRLFFKNAVYELIAERRA
ncbi:MAG: class I SAM-dependent methyltransferase [Solirubrobacteraceae bacterium]|nr:class I SAM-dependent methyltransferase [Solirubrobacteraceae bacterium]